MWLWRPIEKIRI